MNGIEEEYRQNLKNHLQIHKIENDKKTNNVNEQAP